MNRKADVENEARFEERLAEYATALDSGLAEPADPSTLGQADPELAIGFSATALPPLTLCCWMLVMRCRLS